jgi:hypothetical protein
MLMKTRFSIEDVSVLPNGKIVVVGVAVGRNVTLGHRGRASTELGDLDVEVVSVALVDPPPADPNTQMLQLKVLAGTPSWLKGGSLEFA